MSFRFNATAEEIEEVPFHDEDGRDEVPAESNITSGNIFSL